MPHESDEILTFWFDELKPKQHFKKDDSVDRDIAQRFGDVYEMAVQGKLSRWRTDANGWQAEIIVLDQFSRNLYRNDPRAWAQDDKALSLAREMVELGLDESVAKARRSFVYMPYMHTESLEVQRESVRLFEVLGIEHNLKAARRHYEVIEQFGRFPYRNDLLGRQSSEEEIAYVEKHGSF